MIKRNIPNTITLGNLLCGCLAIVKAFEGDLVWAAYLVGIAAVLDFFDGFAARMLKVSSPIGKDLDSLADMVTFGVVPGVILFQLIKHSFVLTGITIYPPLSAANEFAYKAHPYEILNYVAFLIPIFSCIRLARFNNDTRQSESFIGLPTPANAIFICSLPLLSHMYLGSGNTAQRAYLDDTLNGNLITRLVMSSPYFLCTLSLIMSFLLVAPIPLFSLKFKKFGWKGNEIRYSFLAFCLVLIFTLQLLALPLIILSYILFSVGNNLINGSKKPLS